jgi:ankyrin repeat protein
MLKKGIPNIDVLGQNNTTPLMIAAKKGYQDIMKLLLEAGVVTFHY